MPTSKGLNRSLRVVFVLLAMCIAGAVPASAADGPLTLLKTVPVGSLVHDVDVQDHFMYVATVDGLTVVDLSTPSPTIVGFLDTTTLNMGVKVRGQYAYLASYSGGLRVVDITDPTHPELKATRALPYAYDVALKDDVAYVVGFAGEIYLYNITNPLNPTFIRTLGLPAWKGTAGTGLTALQNGTSSGNAKSTAVAVRGNMLLSTDWGYGRMYYWDISTPEAPSFRGTHYAPYILDVDVDDPDSPTGVIYMLSAYSLPSGIYTVPISYVTAGVSTDYSTCDVCGYLPSTVPLVGLDQGGMAVAPGGKYLVYGGGRNNGEFHVVNIQDPLAMSYAATVPIGPHTVPLSTLMGPRISGDLIFFSAGVLGVQIYKFPGLSGATSPPPPGTGPTVTAFAIDDGATSTTDRVVTLNNSVSGTPAQYRASESSDLSGASWLPYEAAPNFSLAAGNGTKQVFFQVRGADLVESAVVGDTITLNEPVPNVTAFAINNGATSVSTRTVTLNNAATSTPTEYLASESSTFAGAVWLPYSTAPSFELSAGTATKRVYFQTRNAAGVSNIRYDTISYSEPKPVVKTFLINNGAVSTTSRTVILNNTTSGTVPTEYRASESSSFTGASWLPYSTAPTFQLSAGVATKRVYFQLRDAAGVLSNLGSDTISLTQ